MTHKKMIAGLSVDGEQTGSGILSVGEFGQVFCWTLPQNIEPAKLKKGYDTPQVLTTKGEFDATVLSVNKRPPREAALLYVHCKPGTFTKPRLRYFHGRLKKGQVIQVYKFEDGKVLFEETRVRLDQRGFRLHFENAPAHVGSPVLYKSRSITCLFGLVGTVGNAGATSVPSLYVARNNIISDVLPRR